MERPGRWRIPSPSDGVYVSCVSGKSDAGEVWLWPVNGDTGFQLTSLGGRVHSMNWVPGNANDTGRGHFNQVQELTSLSLLQPVRAAPRPPRPLPETPL